MLRLIEKASKAAVKKTHPDAGGSAEDFHKVQRAMTVLRDPLKRDKYDRTGNADDQPENDESQALSMLSQQLAAAVGSDFDPRFKDVVQAIRQNISQGIAGHQAQKASIHKTLKRLEQFKTRLRRKDDKPNSLSRVLEGQEREQNHTLGLLDQAIRVSELALTMAADYVYTVDQQPQQQSGMYSLSDMVRAGIFDR
jgi:DnaJ-class molecular chaperone